MKMSCRTFSASLLKLGPASPVNRKKRNCPLVSASRQAIYQCKRAKLLSLCVRTLEESFRIQKGHEMPGCVSDGGRSTFHADTLNRSLPVRFLISPRSRQSPSVASPIPCLSLSSSSEDTFLEPHGIPLDTIPPSLEGFDTAPGTEIWCQMPKVTNYAKRAEGRSVEFVLRFAGS